MGTQWVWGSSRNCILLINNPIQVSYWWRLQSVKNMWQFSKQWVGVWKSMVYLYAALSHTPYSQNLAREKRSEIWSWNTFWLLILTSKMILSGVKKKKKKLHENSKQNRHCSNDIGQIDFSHLSYIIQWLLLFLFYWFSFSIMVHFILRWSKEKQ